MKNDGESIFAVIVTVNIESVVHVRGLDVGLFSFGLSLGLFLFGVFGVVLFLTFVVLISVVPVLLVSVVAVVVIVAVVVVISVLTTFRPVVLRFSFLGWIFLGFVFSFLVVFVVTPVTSSVVVPAPVVIISVVVIPIVIIPVVVSLFLSLLVLIVVELIIFLLVYVLGIDVLFFPFVMIRFLAIILLFGFVIPVIVLSTSIVKVPVVIRTSFMPTFLVSIVTTPMVVILAIPAFLAISLFISFSLLPLRLLSVVLLFVFRSFVFYLSYWTFLFLLLFLLLQSRQPLGFNVVDFLRFLLLDLNLCRLFVYALGLQLDHFNGLDVTSQVVQVVHIHLLHRVLPFLPPFLHVLFLPFFLWFGLRLLLDRLFNMLNFRFVSEVS